MKSVKIPCGPHLKIFSLSEAFRLEIAAKLLGMTVCSTQCMIRTLLPYRKKYIMCASCALITYIENSCCVEGVNRPTVETKHNSCGIVCHIACNKHKFPRKLWYRRAIYNSFSILSSIECNVCNVISLYSMWMKVLSLQDVQYFSICNVFRYRKMHFAANFSSMR